MLHLCTVKKFKTMMRIKVLFFVFVMMAGIAQAQVLKVQGASPSLYLTHTVAAKETWYSIGRLYNVSPKEIAPLNSTTMDKPLAIGQSVKIPLTTNFSQDGNKAADEVFVPVYHTVQEKEWLYRISQNNNKVPVANLEKWNNVTNDGVKPGMDLVVGYLKVKTGQSALAAKGASKITVAAAPPVAKAEPAKEEVKKETPVTATTNPVVNKEITPVKTEEAKTTTTTTVTPPPAEKPVVTTTTPATTPPATTTPVTTTPATTTTTTPVPPATNNGMTPTTNNFKGGYFKSLYSDDGKGTAGNAGIFKSTSGWKDGKYYALMNNVPVGTIIKITFTSTQKTVYAKVLGQLPEMKESIGLTVRLSDAAASELGAENGKFYVDVKY
jgi:LysM repeat protein